MMDDYRDVDLALAIPRLREMSKKLDEAIQAGQDSLIPLQVHLPCPKQS